MTPPPAQILLLLFNCWVLYPVACVSTNTLIKTTVRNKCFYARFIVYYLQHVSAPIGYHLQVKCTQKYILKRPLCTSTDPLSQLYKGKCHSQVSQITVL
jgi:hypothetical protein